MSDPRADQITELKQSIAVLEDQQRSLGIDLSLPLRLQRERLAQLEQAAPAVSQQSGGVSAAADQLTVAGDVTGRDKIDSHDQTITAVDSAVAAEHSAAANNQSVANTGTIHGHVLINSTLIIYTGDDPAVRISGWRNI